MNGAITERKGITYCMQRELVGHQEMTQMKRITVPYTHKGEHCRCHVPFKALQTEKFPTVQPESSAIL